MNDPIMVCVELIALNEEGEWDVGRVLMGVSAEQAANGLYYQRLIEGGDPADTEVRHDEDNLSWTVFDCYTGDVIATFVNRPIERF